VKVIHISGITRQFEDGFSAQVELPLQPEMRKEKPRVTLPITAVREIPDPTKHIVECTALHSLQSSSSAGISTPQNTIKSKRLH
jgi:hypothetical protein